MNNFLGFLSDLKHFEFTAQEVLALYQSIKYETSNSIFDIRPFKTDFEQGKEHRFRVILFSNEKVFVDVVSKSAQAELLRLIENTYCEGEDCESWAALKYNLDKY